MLRLGRALAALGGAVAVLLVGGVAPAYAAGGTFQQCLDQAVNHNGEPPTCTKVNGTWVASWPEDTALSGGGGTGAFAFFFVVVIVVAIGTTIWKVSTVQKLARQSGMDPGLATQMTLLTDDGLDATYLAASLRQPPAVPPGSPSTPAPTPKTAAERLAELGALRDQGMVTQAEYDERRKAIIDAV
jgi:hypothetical protein